MLEIVLIRHGQTDWNRERRVMGRRPIPLNAVGRREAKRLARTFDRVSIDAFYSSPVHRAMETSRLIVCGRRLSVKRAPEMAEILYGVWEGRTFDEIGGDQAYQIYHKTPRRAHPPGGERIVDVYNRAVGFIERLRRRHRGGRVLVVSHADVIKAVLIRYLGLDLNHLLKLRVDNGSISLLWFNGTRERVLAVNCPPSPKGLFSKTDQHPPLFKRR